MSIKDDVKTHNPLIEQLVEDVEEINRKRWRDSAWDYPDGEKHPYILAIITSGWQRYAPCVEAYNKECTDGYSNMLKYRSFYWQPFYFPIKNDS